MNILFLCDEYPPGRHGGIGTVVQTLAREMVRQGHRVVVAGFYDWSYGGEDEFTDEGVRVYRFRRKLAARFFENPFSFPVRVVNKLLKVSGIFEWDIKKSLERYRLFIEQLIKENNIEIIEMPDYTDYMRFCNRYVAFPKFSVPVVVKLHGSLTHIAKGNNVTLPKRIWHMEHDILEQADAVCSVSKYAAAMAVENFDYKKEITTLYNGIDTSFAVTGVSKHDGLAVFTGSLSVNKGIYQLMQAWNKVIDAVPQARLYVYGKGPVEKIKTLLSQQAKDTVDFKGHVPRQELSHVLATANLAVFPSYAENFAMAPMEAMLNNTAIVYTKRTSGPELIDDGINGLLADPDNVQELADKMIYLLTNKEECKKIAENGRRKILERFDLKIITGIHIEYYKTIISQHKKQ